MSILRRMKFATVIVAAAVIAAASPAPAQNAQESSTAADTAGASGASGTSAMSPRQLSNQRWRERAYGLSLRLPLQTRTRSQTADDYLLRIADERGHFTMSVAVKRSRSLLTVEEVAGTAVEQIFETQGTSEILERRQVELSGHPAAVVYARVPQPIGTDMLMGQALVQLDPRTFAILEVRCDIADADPIRVTFQGMLDSLRITDPAQIDRERREALRRTQQWQRKLSPDELHAALVEEQTYRLTSNGDDIGYMRVRQREAERERKPGVEVEVQTRVLSGGSTYDTLATYFLADDGSAERWSIKTTRRPAGASRSSAGVAPDDDTATYVETGIRNAQTVTILLDGPWGHKKREFEAPELGYLSQAGSWLLPQTLPIESPATYGFYSYNTQAGELTYHTAEVIPTLSGFTIKTRLRPNDPVMKATYTADRQLVEKQLGPDRKQTPASPAMIQHVWRGR